MERQESLLDCHKFLDLTAQPLPRGGKMSEDSEKPDGIKCFRGILIALGPSLIIWLIAGWFAWKAFH
jgi:hypothetical protein